MSSIKRFLCLSIFLLIGTTTTTASAECPEHCDCINYQTYNHTKCTNLDGLRQIGKTPTIQSVDISAIGLTKLTNQLDKLTNLTQLNLSDNHLSEVPKLNRRIKTLNLSHNRITSGKLAKIPQFVQHLNLSYNDITYIPLEFRRLTRLKTLDLAGNPINCSCDTLEVRNWLQEQHVWSDQSIICTSPLAEKGKPWLQVKQSEICSGVNTTVFADPDDNELMLGDQPVFGDGSGEENETNGDEVENGFLPISEANIREDTVNINDDDPDGSGDDLPTEATTKGLELLFDGSGSFNTSIESAMDSAEITTEATDYDDDDEVEDDGSGSGGGILFIPSAVKVSEPEPDDYDDTAEEELTKTPDRLNIFGTGVTSAPPAEPNAVTEDTLVPVEVATTGAEANNEKKSLPIMGTSGVVAPQPNVVHPEIDDSKAADTHESQGTMILLIILGVALVALLAFLIFKRKKVEGRNRRGKDDIESPKGTELAEMDKNSALGKPLVKNGNGNAEFAPLIGQNDIGKSNGNRLPDGEKKDNGLKDAQEPLLKKLNEPEMEAEKPKAEHEYENEKPKREPEPEPKMENEKPEVPPAEKNNNNPQPVSPIPPYKRPNQQNVHKSPVVQNGYPPDDDDDDVFKPAPVSPRPSRYSPVYSPETGRVKIRLTETPKPRTPMLVTRTRSNAGDIILTPAHRPSDLSNSQ